MLIFLRLDHEFYLISENDCMQKYKTVAVSSSYVTASNQLRSTLCIFRQFLICDDAMQWKELRPIMCKELLACFNLYYLHLFLIHFEADISLRMTPHPQMQCLFVSFNLSILAASPNPPSGCTDHLFLV